MSHVRYERGLLLRWLDSRVPGPPACTAGRKWQ